MRQRCLQCWQVLFLPLFLKHSLSASSLGCNALCIVISFLFLWSICLSSSLVHLRKGPEYLTRGTAQVFIHLVRFLLLSFVSSSFLVLLRYSFWIFSIGPAVRVFANGPGDLGSIPGRVIPKTLKMELDTTLLNTQHYKVRFKGKVEQSWEWSSALPYTLV